MADLVKQVSLTAPPSGIPLDLQSRAAQLAIAQQLATELLQQGAITGPPAIHTGGQNPFARDIPNILSPLMQVINAYAGRSGMDRASEGLGQLNQLAAARRIAAMQNMSRPITLPGEAPPDVYGGGPPTPDMQRSPTGIEMAQRGLQDPNAMLDPQTQALVSSLMEHQYGIAEKFGMTPANVGEMLSTRGGNVTPPALAASLQKDPFTGVSFLNAGTLASNGPSQQPKYMPSQPGEILNPVPQVGAVPAPAITNTPPTRPIIPPGEPGNPTDLPLTSNVKGEPEVLRGIEASPRLATAKAGGIENMQELNVTRKDLIEHQQLMSKIPQIVSLAQRALRGITGELRQDILRLAVDMGLSEDTVANIPASQTLMALMMPFTTEKSRALNPRAAAQVIEMTQEATAGGHTVDPRHVVDIAGNLVTEYANNVRNFNEKTIPYLATGPVGQRAYEAKVQWDPSKIGLPPDSPIRIKQSPNGDYINEGLAQPRPIGQATSLSTRIPVKLKDGTTVYHDPKTGKTFSAP